MGYNKTNHNLRLFFDELPTCHPRSATILRVTDFRTVKDAKDFLVNRIVAQAQRENVPLSEVERKMLYWSDADMMLPDMRKFSDEFDRDYDQNKYEQKIARLVANIAAGGHHQNEDEEEKWDAAVCKLSEGDHYLSVLIGNVHLPSGGFVPMFYKPTIRPKNDFPKLLLTAFALIPFFFALVALSEWFFASKFWLATGWDVPDRDKWLLAVLILVAGYFLVPKLWQIIRMRSSRP